MDWNCFSIRANKLSMHSNTTDWKLASFRRLYATSNSLKSTESRHKIRGVTSGSEIRRMNHPPPNPLKWRLCIRSTFTSHVVLSNDQHSLHMMFIMDHLIRSEFKIKILNGFHKKMGQFNTVGAYGVSRQWLIKIDLWYLLKYKRYKCIVYERLRCMNDQAAFRYTCVNLVHYH